MMLRWTGLSTARWCAVILLVIIAIASAHAAIPDHKTGNDCSICKALQAPGLTVESAVTTALPPPTSKTPTPGPTFRPQLRLRGLSSLRAPPSFS